MRKQKNRQKGITLIALVVTIIILIILAGVSISMLVGDNGIITQVQNAKEETENGEKEEKEKLEEAEIAINKIQKIKFSDAITPTNYGDYISYNVDLNSNGDITDDWRIFYNNGENVFLIAADYLNNKILPTEVKMTADQEFSKYSIYWNNKNIEELESCSIDEETVTKFMFNWFGDYPDSINHSNTKAVCCLLDTSVWNTLARGIEGAKAIGGPTLEMFVASWNEKGYETLYCNNSNSNGYYIGTNDNPTGFAVNLSSYEDDLYFIETKDNVNAYWIASPTYTGDDHIACIFSDHVVYYQYYERQNIGIRPVICLPENAMANKVEDIWNLVI